MKFYVYGNLVYICPGTTDGKKLKLLQILSSLAWVGFLYTAMFSFAQICDKIFFKNNEIK